MSESKIDVHSPDYNRPHHEWLCGRNEDGSPCPLGPSGLGVCRVEKQCSPELRGQRWVCSRVAEQGGPCDAGPSASGDCACAAEKCTPIRSIRARRGVLAISSATLMAGLIAFGFNGPWANDILAPGPLSKAHGQILNGTERCSACHPAAISKFSNWVTATYEQSRAFDATQTEKCLHCHEKTMIAQTATLAHTADAERLRQVTVKQVAAVEQRAPRAIPAHLQSDIACSTCHHEHHGDSNLSALTSKQCQACHQTEFTSFNNGHPEFAEWPYATDRGISFDHANHLGKYFQQTNKQITCNQCHVVDQGHVVAVASYEKTCATCHDGFMDQVDSIAVVKLPIIDPKVFANVGLTVDEWPAAAIGDFDGKLPIFSRVLLLADERASAAMQRLGHSFDFFDLDIENDQQLEDAALIAFSLKKLVYELSIDGHAAIEGRFESVLGRELSQLELQSITGQMPPVVFRAAQERWFPNVAKNIRDRTRNANTVVVADVEELGGRESVAFGGWFVDSEVCSIGYRPIGHNDELTRSWIELMAELQTKVSGDHDWEAEFNSLSLTKQCSSCHVNSDKRQWTGTSATAIMRGFTRFDHGPHLVLPQLADCTSCHGVGWEASSSDGESTATSETTAIPNESANETLTLEHCGEFTAMDKTACAACHTPSGAGNDCTMCHNYHVDFGRSL